MEAMLFKKSHKNYNLQVITKLQLTARMTSTFC